jgi:hypothetical protein
MKPLFFMKTTKILARKDQWQIPWLHHQFVDTDEYKNWQFLTAKDKKV